MQAIILAAGMGRRLGELTKDRTKCMVEVNGVTLIERLLRQLDCLSLSRIVMVVGYEGGKLMNYIRTLDINTPISYINNTIYDKTNNIYSLALAKEYLRQEDTLLFESDLIVEDGVIDALLDDPRDTLALVDRYESWMDGTCVRLNEDDKLTGFVSRHEFQFDKTGTYYKTVNIYKFSASFSQTHYIPFLEAYLEALGTNEYYEQVLRVIATLDDPVIQAKRLDEQLWYEIDDIQDLDIASVMFAPDAKQRITLLQERYGGYWRYPRLMDFCYLVNPYFPPQKMLDEMQASFSKLLTQYPSGMKVNALLAGKCFGLRAENVVVGNGAAELIKSLMSRIKGRVGIVRPTFEEYAQRYPKDQLVCFRPCNSAFAYTAQDLMNFFESRPIEHLIVINPDNPSGNYIPKKDILTLAEWAQQRNIGLVVDESFADFADEPDNTLLYTEILRKYPRLYVMKSISKSYGVPGLRLGVLACGDTAAIAALKKDVPIWNINSFAEFYMQIADKYAGDYRIALDKFRSERDRYQTELSRLPGLRLIPSQANYIMAEIMNGKTAAELTGRLVDRHHILIKDLTAKLGRGQYVRLAVKTTEENSKLIAALQEELS